MSRWFRMYGEVLNDPKVQKLPGDLFRAWVNILCIASQNNGFLCDLETVAFGLRVSEAKAGAIVADLTTRALLDRVDGGYFQPHNWDGRQYASDSSTPRVNRFRERKKQQQGNVTCNVTETSEETAPDTEQNRAEQKDTSAHAPRFESGWFERFWEAYPKRDGANPSAPAEKAFRSAVCSGPRRFPDGEIAEAIIAGAQRYSAEVQEKGQVGTPYVAQAITWLRQRRWVDYQPPPDDPESRRRHDEVASRNGYAWDPAQGKFVKKDEAA